MFNSNNATVNPTQSSPFVSTTSSFTQSQSDEPWLLWLEVPSIVALMICVVIGNLMVLYCLFTIKELQTVTGMFLTNLAVTDLGVGLISLPLALAASIEHELVHFRWFCVMQGMAMVLFIVASLLTLGVLSLAKYINVSYSVMKRFSKRHAKYAIRGIWVIAVMFAIAPAFGFSMFDHSIGGHQCAPYEDSVRGYIFTALMLTIGFIIPSTTMLYCYCKLYKMMHSHIRRVRVNDAANATSSRQNLSSVESHMIHTLIIMVAALFICWLPALVFYILNFTRILMSSTFDTIVMLCVFANSAVNPILYAMRQNDFQRGFRQIVMSGCTKNSINDVSRQDVNHGDKTWKITSIYRAEKETNS